MTRPVLAVLTAAALLAAITPLASPALSAGPFDAPAQVNVEVEPSGGAAAFVRASIDIAAPPSAVYATLFECADAPRFTPNLMSCKVLGRGPGWEEREHRSKGPIFHPVVTNRFRLDYVADQRLSFRRTGGDWKRSDGEWRLTPLNGGKATHLTYAMHFAIDAPIPASALRDGIAKGMPKSLEIVRKESLRRAGH